jgi:RNA polymerase sigma factor (sigma-70 family)
VDDGRYDMPRNQDAKLLQQLKQGSPQAVQAWFHQYQPKLFRLISKKVNNDKDAEELTQDIFVSCLKHLPLFRGESSIWTWMVNVARHEVADFYRKRYAKKFIHALPLSELISFEDIHNAHEITQQVKSVLQKMSKEHREILLMKYVDQKKVESIAQQMGKTVKSIESILFRARAEFKTLYALEK